MNKKILIVSIISSLICHGLPLAFLQKYSRAAHVKSPILLEKIFANKILQESFQNHFIKEKNIIPAKCPSPERAQILLTPLLIQPIIAPPTSITETTIAPHDDLKEKNHIITFTLPPIELLNLFEHLPKAPTLFLPLSSSLRESHPSYILEPVVRYTPVIPVNPPPWAHTQDDAKIGPNVATASVHPFSATLPTSRNQGISSDFLNLANLSTTSYSEFFDTEIFFYPLENEDRYVFAVTLIPHPALDLPKLNQQYSFLIDRSNSIQKERLNIVKNSILKAIENLDIEDSFNIIAFDSKAEKLSPTPLIPTSSSIQAAKDFLNAVQLGSFFSTSNLLKPLLLTTPSSEDDRLQTTILFSDGESLNKKLAQRELGLDWTHYNNGRVALFAVGVKGDPNLSILEVAATFNRGKMFQAPTRKGIKRKLLKLMKSIGHPIAKNVTATAIAHNSLTKIGLFPKSQYTPLLYQNEPYVIMGIIDHLDPFTLFLQGKCKNKWFNVKKTITFINAKKAEPSLQGEWARSQALSLYEDYLLGFDPQYLSKAQELLEPHHLQAAFQ